MRAFVCEKCRLVQLVHSVSPEELFSHYAYFSSYSESWLQYAKDYARDAVERFGLDSSTPVIEIASNDGYLLQYFKEKDIPVLGIEPARNVASVAEQSGIPTLVAFFSEATAAKLAAQGNKPKFLVGNNVLAHVPDINDFVAGLKTLLARNGVVTMEFPHLLRLMEQNQFDTIYHEHFSYLSLMAVETIFAFHGLRIFDVDELPTHGGSLRIYACHTENKEKPDAENLHRLLSLEREAGLHKLETYTSFGEKVKATKRNLVSYLIELKNRGKTIVGYGAPAKGNTLLNYCGIGKDFLDYTVDRNPHKQGLFLPGTHIPIYAPDKIAETKPDYVLILPWNLKDEIVNQMAHIRSWGAKFIVPIPTVREI
ncbi:MAG: methyltransferase domain-containing protein [Deltaproteobacteria bacterium]|nr:methyltransferase domain-containing protein [Deltaproteobacteria bacterium]